jgi:hypothetical protein
MEVTGKRGGARPNSGGARAGAGRKGHGYAKAIWVALADTQAAQALLAYRLEQTAGLREQSTHRQLVRRELSPLPLTEAEKPDFDKWIARCVNFGLDVELGRIIGCYEDGLE